MAKRVSPPSAGGRRRSRQQDLILDVFLKHEGHVSADDLFDAVRRVHPGIGRATVYRTLQRFVDTGLAYRVDFGDGRLRYEATHGRPRHFHLICQTCHRSSEFLSSDVEGLLAEISAARNFEPSQAVVQIFGTCEDCRTGKVTPLIDGPSTGRVFARDALRMAIDTERNGLEFYTRAAQLTRNAKGRRVFEQLAAEEREHLSTLEARYRQLLSEDPLLEARPTFLFFKGAANKLFATGSDRLRRGVNDEQAFQIGIVCERGSHRFFKRYGERFEDSEGKRIFLEFADEERVHLDLLVRELRALRESQPRTRRARPSS